ncbi:hypothetical protein Sgly_1568 [Syntrophobotulus glycolicus DSM 8271]|uniref:DUF4474 domain-containing protein n=1 Tax=Syntrophobotulus glycolicus (strain DSM 8271 / FlGlyR) TaxID=645991 RepID=F0SXN5_SYNGF|nr:DUF4474 domain-containing protein [Syntrophobotulus glycolicus]ADY55868.1 hypothetical protein Sgly_1568 [Syntrophobotulus glycolicus DSM 8271]
MSIKVKEYRVRDIISKHQVTPGSNEQSKVLPQVMNNDELTKAVEIAGYSYDTTQDIFYSAMDAWQRKFGYCHLYDEAAAVMGMIVDCEPVYFQYGGKKWLIEFWKGQYDLVTGCEVGVYIEAFNLKIPGVFNGTFYDCAGDDDLLQISYCCKKKGRILFTREGKHWWLTGFKLGEFSEPSELMMDISITLKDKIMCKAFVAGLKKTGYSDKEFFVNGNTVRLIFHRPRTPQPITRTRSTDRLIQTKNEYLCNLYQEITGAYDDMQDKMKAIEEKAPEIYDLIMNMGKGEKFYTQHRTIVHLNKAKQLYESHETVLGVMIVIGVFGTGLFISAQLLSKISEDSKKIREGHPCPELKDTHERKKIKGRVRASCYESRE